MGNLIIEKGSTLDPLKIPCATIGSNEVAFAISGIRKLSFDSGDNYKEIVDYLAHRIASEPSDLRSHVQRIHQHLQQQDADSTYGALLDLFISLGEKGTELRQRMLKQARHIIGSDLTRALESKLKEGVNASDQMPLAVNSMLSGGLTGTSQIVVRPVKTSLSTRDPIIEAQEHLEYGQVEEAKKLLEKALFINPWRKDLQYDLLEIYKYTKNRESYSSMLQQLKSIGAPLVDEWEDTANLVFYK